ncbi:thermonuclease family protein [Maritalea sp. S77]|uniref:thermonuclease family protein n=1 Tax=Maritalea sp. S77 TaxID=3415125 RepID=UPI003C7E56CA
MKQQHIFKIIIGIIPLSLFPTTSASAIDVCKGGNRAERKVTCVYDGDTGWENGVKWRTLGIDTPEINSSASCGRENRLGHQSRDRLIQLMNQGYQIRWSGNSGGAGRQLVDVLTLDGRNTADILKSEGLAQNWPNNGNIWCN